MRGEFLSSLLVQPGQPGRFNRITRSDQPDQIRLSMAFNLFPFPLPAKAFDLAVFALTRY